MRFVRNRLGRDRSASRLSEGIREHGGDTTAVVGSRVTPEQVYHDAALHLLSTQVAANESLNARVAQAFGTGILVLPTTGALLNLSQVDVPDASLYCLGVALGAFALLLVFVFRIYRMRQFEFGPEPDVIDRYIDTYAGDPLGGEILLRWVARGYGESTHRNGTILEVKVRVVGYMQLALYLETIGLIAAVAAIFVL